MLRLQVAIQDTIKRDAPSDARGSIEGIVAATIEPRRVDIVRCCGIEVDNEEHNDRVDDDVANKVGGLGDQPGVRHVALIGAPLQDAVLRYIPMI